MDKCPVCRAATADEASACRRCRADLAPLLAIERQANALARRAVQRLKAGDLAQAQAAASASRFQQDSPLTRAILQFISRLTAGESCGNP